MGEQLKRFVRYLYVYKVYGLLLYAKIYWLKQKAIHLKGYGIIHFRPATFDAEIFTQMFIYRQYNFDIKGPVKTIIDLGGNNGMSALFFHKKYPEAMIYVLEPDKKNFAALLAHTTGIDKIVALNKAIWKEDGFVNLDSGDSWAVRIDMQAGTNVAEAISMQSLMATYQLQQIDLLKIDIESAEKELFESSVDFLSKTKNLVIELHDWLRPGCAKPFFKSLVNFSYTYAVNHENTLITELQLEVHN